MRRFRQETTGFGFHGVGLCGMDATRIVSGMMLKMLSALQSARTSRRLSEIPDLPVHAQKRFCPDAAYLQRSIIRSM